VVPDGAGCESKLNVSMPPGIQYFASSVSGDSTTRFQFFAARLDSLRVSLDARCQSRVFYRLDRPADAPSVSGSSTETVLFNRLLAQRRYQTADELYDLDNDPGMTRNLISDPSLTALRQQLERRAQELYTQTYGRAFDHRQSVPVLPREEIEKLKSLGYLF
jgi:hypothetical protein